MKALQTMCNTIIWAGVILLIGIAGASDCGVIDFAIMLRRVTLACGVILAGALIKVSIWWLSIAYGGRTYGKGSQSKIKTALSA